MSSKSKKIKLTKCLYIVKYIIVFKKTQTLETSNTVFDTMSKIISKMSGNSNKALATHLSSSKEKLIIFLNCPHLSEGKYSCMFLFLSTSFRIKVKLMTLQLPTSIVAWHWWQSMVLWKSTMFNFLVQLTQNLSFAKWFVKSCPGSNCCNQSQCHQAIQWNNTQNQIWWGNT